MISSLELARLCGVSQGTVDRALHDRPGISPKTRERILAVAQEHGYRPHPAARELLTGQRKTVGVVLPGMNGLFFMDLINQIRLTLSSAGYRLVITQADGEDDLLESLEDFAARRARMVLAVPPGLQPVIPERLWRAVDIGLLVSARPVQGVQCLVPDEVQTGRLAARYLLGKGHRRLLHVTYPRPLPAVEDRALGFERELAEAGLRAPMLRDFDERELVACVREQGITAVFCHNDWLALTAMRTLEAACLSVPGDVSVLGVDGSPSFVALCPGITTLRYPAESIARSVLAWLTRGAPSAIDPLELVERQSVRAIG